MSYHFIMLAFEMLALLRYSCWIYISETVDAEPQKRYSVEHISRRGKNA